MLLLSDVVEACLPLKTCNDSFRCPPSSFKERTDLADPELYISFRFPRPIGTQTERIAGPLSGLKENSPRTKIVFEVNKDFSQSVCYPLAVVSKDKPLDSRGGEDR